jgi:uncharacterized OB-fold protein
VPVIAPRVGQDDAYFWEGVAESRLLLRGCVSCGHLQHPPTPMCQKCGGLQWSVRDASGKGVVYSWIVAKHPTEADGAGRVVALVELAEGVRLVANLSADPSTVANGLPVEVFFADVDGVRLPQFRPVAAVSL